MPSILVTGSSRGIGLEWCGQHAEAGWRVFATCRHPETGDALQGLEIATPGDTYYRSSKAALNAAMKDLSLALAQRASACCCFTRAG